MRLPLVILRSTRPPSTAEASYVVESGSNMAYEKQHDRYERIIHLSFTVNSAMFEEKNSETFVRTLAQSSGSRSTGKFYGVVPKEGCNVCELCG